MGLDEEAEDTLLLRLYTGEFDRTAAVYATPEQRQAQSAQVGEEADGQAKSRKRKLRYSSDEESEEDEEDAQGPTAKRVKVRSNVPSSSNTLYNYSDIGMNLMNHFFVTTVGRPGIMPLIA